MKVENSHRFFNNSSCKYFPCHQEPDPETFNCLFCYCPLYAMGDKCPGQFEYFKGIKMCTDCHLPHEPDFYDVVIEQLKEANK